MTVRAFAPEACPVREKFAATRRELSEALIERDGEVDLALTAMVARENLLLVGAPGCAKSLLLDSLMRWMRGRKFAILLNRFTTPEEVLGPISVAGLEADVHRRVTAGKLPEADLAFLDEVFKASSAILNVMLKILNERTYEVGDGTSVAVPFRLCVAAGNEWPSPEDSKELSALFDRFCLRKSVRPVLTRSDRGRLLWHDDLTPKLSTSITPAEVDRAHDQAMRLPWTEEAREAAESILRELAKEGIQPGDRRQRKSIGVARAFVWLCGADRVEPEHLEVLAHVLWDSPEEQPEKVAQVVARIANPTGMRLNQLLFEGEEILSSTDVRNLAQAATATAKLQEIDKRLGTLKADGRVGRARAYVKEQVREIRLASIDSL